MEITITGFDGRYTGAKLKATKGMVLPKGIITKVNAKSIHISPLGESNDEFENVTEMSLCSWEVPSEHRDYIKDSSGNQYAPTDIEQAIITLSQADTRDTVTAIGNISEASANKVNLKDTAIHSNYNSLSSEAMLAMISQIINK